MHNKLQCLFSLAKFDKTTIFTTIAKFAKIAIMITASLSFRTLAILTRSCQKYQIYKNRHIRQINGNILPLGHFCFACISRHKQNYFDLFQLCFIFAAILVSSSGVITYFMEPESSKTMIYPAVTLLGFGFSLMLVNSLSFATDLIGDNTVNILSNYSRFN